MTRRTLMTLVAATAAALTPGAALVGCGTAVSPPSSSSPSSSSTVAQPHNQADITFAQGMIPHHAQAIAMSQMAVGRAGSAQVKDLAARIQGAQQPEIDEMSGWLRVELPGAFHGQPYGDHGAYGSRCHVQHDVR